MPLAFPPVLVPLGTLNISQGELADFLTKAMSWLILPFTADKDVTKLVLFVPVLFITMLNPGTEGLVKNKAPVGPVDNPEVLIGETGNVSE